MTQKYDVAVFGSGMAGMCAALQAARAGSRVLLVERNPMPGGTTTSGGIAFPGLFYAWKKQIISGIGWELAREAAELSGEPLPHFAEQIGMQDHPRYQVRFQPLVFAMLCDEKLAEAGVECCYHTLVARTRREAERCWHVELTMIDGAHEVEAKILVDATGDGNLAALCNCRMNRASAVQPATLSCRASGYDPAALDQEELAQAAAAAVRDGRLRWTDLSWNACGYSGQFLEQHGNNSNHIAAMEPHTAAGRSRLEIEGRMALLRAYRFFRARKGLEKIRFDFGAFETGVRESGTVDAEKNVSIDEYVSGTLFPDAVGYAFYPVDLHESTPKGVEPRVLREGTLPSVPLRALIPKGSNDLLVAGRCIGSDRLANSALRVQATAGMTGQAAGAAAHLAAQEDIAPGALSFATLTALLRESGAIVPEQPQL
ncbi:MAG: FAD-dependent oxidoreductase [Victivallaceae bacterium]|nr:FAD-dependent oxidoreductase [Victivallaceae bacterium]